MSSFQFLGLFGLSRKSLFTAASKLVESRPSPCVINSVASCISLVESFLKSLLNQACSLKLLKRSRRILAIAFHQLVALYSAAVLFAVRAKALSIFTRIKCESLEALRTIGLHKDHILRGPFSFNHNHTITHCVIEVQRYSILEQARVS